MRRLTDTLPTLNDAPARPSAPRIPGPTGDGSFDPAAVVRALAAKRASATAPEEARVRTTGDEAGAAASPDFQADGETGRGASSSPRAAETARSRLAALAANQRERGARKEAHHQPREDHPNDGHRHAGDRNARDRGGEQARASSRSESREGIARPGRDGRANDARGHSAEGTARDRQSSAASTIPSLDAPQEIPGEDPVAVAVTEALSTAEAEKTAAIEAAVAQERAAAEDRLAEARVAWAAESAAPLAAQLEEAFEVLHTRLSDSCGKALAPLADRVVRERALRRFSALLDDLLGATAESPAITVRGPADLLAALGGIMGERRSIALEADEAADLSVTIEETRIETTISAWAEDLASALGNPPKRTSSPEQTHTQTQTQAHAAISADSKADTAEHDGQHRDAGGDAGSTTRRQPVQDGSA